MVFLLSSACPSSACPRLRSFWNTVTIIRILFVPLAGNTMAGMLFRNSGRYWIERFWAREPYKPCFRALGFVTSQTCLKTAPKVWVGLSRRLPLMLLVIHRIDVPQVSHWHSGRMGRFPRMWWLRMYVCVSTKVQRLFGR